MWLRADGSAHVVRSIRLVNAHTDRKAWVRDFAGPTADVRELQRQLKARGIEAYVAEHQLPAHPLVAEGYPSIGCSPAG